MKDVLMFDLNQDLNYYLSKVQNDEENRKYTEIVERIQSLKNYDAEYLIKNLNELYKNIKEDESNIDEIIKTEERMNSFRDQLDKWRSVNKTIKDRMMKEFKFTEAKFKSNIN